MGLGDRLHADAASADPDHAALKQLYGMAMREAEVLTQNTLFKFWESYFSLPYC
ncbi:MAG: hypothetical protein ACU84H_02960 [Gammaproteobacteria bacterium]